LFIPIFSNSLVFGKNPIAGVCGDKTIVLYPYQIYYRPITSLYQESKTELSDFLRKDAQVQDPASAGRLVQILGSINATL
jgi:hypothetical protein